MTEQQKNTIRAFSEWMEANGISNFLVAGDDDNSVLAMQGDTSVIGAGLTVALLKDIRVSEIIREASSVALIANIADAKTPEENG